MTRLLGRPRLMLLIQGGRLGPTRREVVEQPVLRLEEAAEQPLELAGMGRDDCFLPAQALGLDAVFPACSALFAIAAVGSFAAVARYEVSAVRVKRPAQVTAMRTAGYRRAAAAQV